ncbi:dehydrogenase/reductase SDR family protein 7-like [Pectinophora gossypiella]|uniref:dehydrogenase/reductase SDR family protein 7-like n=1 Tax=Pectinophora gossypiella TaxID=13191 RepID=UPI00214EBD93|nr:dehydrogenase/reductase SDR family protein 7-like [Pectinophora gossypiella]
MKPHSSLDSATWYLKYFALPLTVGAITMYKILDCFSNRKRRVALQGKVVVITGASSGIGEALAHALYEQGSKVVLAARREGELNRVKQDLIAKKLDLPVEEPVVLPLDLADLDQVENFVQKVYEICGHIDILINNGGITHRGAIVHTKLEVDQQIMCVNYFGTVALTKAILPKMVERQSGHIAFVSSVQGLIAIPGRSAYAAAKHAMQAFADSLRAEMHQHNINVTVISPGYVKTAISLNALTGTGDKHGVMDPSTAAGLSPEYCAVKIMDSIVNKEKEIIISQFMPKLAVFVRRSMPSFYFWYMARRATKSPIY